MECGFQVVLVRVSWHLQMFTRHATAGRTCRQSLAHCSTFVAGLLAVLVGWSEDSRGQGGEDLRKSRINHWAKCLHSPESRVRGEALAVFWLIAPEGVEAVP